MNDSTPRQPDLDLFAGVPEDFTPRVIPAAPRRRSPVRESLEKGIRPRESAAASAFSSAAPREAPAPEPPPRPETHVPSAPFVPQSHLRPVCTAEEVRRFREAVAAQLAADARWASGTHYL